jgi:hypothetical protein
LRLEIKLFPYHLITYNVFSEYAIQILENFKMSILLKGYIFYSTHLSNWELTLVRAKDTGVRAAYRFTSGSIN